MGWTTDSQGNIVDSDTGLPIPNDQSNFVSAPASISSAFPPDGATQTTDPSLLSAAPVVDQDASMGTRFESWIGNMGNSIKTFDSNAGSFIVSEVKAGYNTTKDALGTVAHDVASPLTSIIDYGTTKIFILIAVLGIGLYFVGKGGIGKNVRVG